MYCTYSASSPPLSNDCGVIRKLYNGGVSLEEVGHQQTQQESLRGPCAYRFNIRCSLFNSD
ncbi:hypothetical protein EXN66_Car010005 [Channa argus]|uniref:Uncharacterized protein n=1 Tax=Channa argus TaxID=215402 RepID=A0A6G1PVR8_CHAAH|nr:hypothetical protein EXN66_Car010005 [Channa argus]